MPKRGFPASDHELSPHTSRAMRRRACRLERRGEERKALALLRDAVAREPTGATYCWLADALVRAGRREQALEALRQALYFYRHEDMRGRARTVARWILALDPGDDRARKRAA
jgi:tetratricopeptide (TPR) repeat protein